MVKVYYPSSRNDHTKPPSQSRETVGSGYSTEIYGRHVTVEGFNLWRSGREKTWGLNVSVDWGVEEVTTDYPQSLYCTSFGSRTRMGGLTKRVQRGSSQLCWGKKKELVWFTNLSRNQGRKEDMWCWLTSRLGQSRRRFMEF